MSPSRGRARRVALAAAIALCCGASGVAAESLYEPFAYESLASDLVAAKPGDTLTVLILESSLAQASASSGTDRELDIGGQASGQISGVGGGSADGSLAVQNAFDGDARINRSGRLVGTVSVVVEEVLPNGELVVRGTQNLILNEETQTIDLKGQVRPVDIERDNTVLSTRLSNATIEYVGDGILADTTRKSWITRVIEWIF